MSNKLSDTQSVQSHFQAVDAALLKALRALTRVNDPAASVALQELKGVADALAHLQDGVATRLLTGKDRLASLMEVGHVINSSLGLEAVLAQVMDALIALMQAERGFLMLRNEADKLDVRVARGMAGADLEGEAFAFSRTIVQRVASSGQPVLTTDAQQDPRFGQEMSVISLHLRSILCVPLKIKDELIGVIYVDNRAHIGLFKDVDLELLSAFADQAAVAINNARLFDGLQAANRSLEAANEELQIAYDATLKGWVRALDLRDKETKGHTQRVSYLTRMLAEAVGFAGTDLEHITRGALLHDIGKMGIPDSILLKPGELTFDERERMKQHPVLAYEMLHPIQFLQPALDIPYCHHEKWDGTGYPRGLQGEAIPITARIFSIVDVWDALTSNRPYRKAMDHGEVRDYIRKQCGIFFDARIVDIFLGLKDLSLMPVAE
ncbi:MAG: HD domain-containing phosphohydrolase [Chloroflexota bacterium]